MPRKPYTLVVDIGNTSTSAALYRDGRVSAERRRPSQPLDAQALHEFLERVVGRRTICDAVAASVVPRLKPLWSRAVRARCGVPLHWVTHRSPLGIRVRYSRPETLGADRLANVVGAVGRYGAPAVIIDIGTALTIEVVTEKGEFVGGLIAPGFSMMLDYLADRTAALPRIEPRKVRRAVGRSTEEAMRIGAELGYRGLVRELIRCVRSELGSMRATWVATGGFARRMVPAIDSGIRVDPTLTLYGLGRIGDLRRAAGPKLTGM